MFYGGKLYIIIKFKVTHNNNNFTFFYEMRKKKSYFLTNSRWRRGIGNFRDRTNLYESKLFETIVLLEFVIFKNRCFNLRQFKFYCVPNRVTI